MSARTVLIVEPSKLYQNVISNVLKDFSVEFIDDADQIINGLKYSLQVEFCDMDTFTTGLGKCQSGSSR